MTPTKKDYKHAVKCLTKARNFLADPNNWGRGTMQAGDTGARCAIGAVRVACLGSAYVQAREIDSSPPYQLAVHALAISNKLVDHRFNYQFGTHRGEAGAVIDWNDNQAGGKGHETVIAGFDKAITYLEEEME